MKKVLYFLSFSLIIAGITHSGYCLPFIGKNKNKKKISQFSGLPKVGFGETQAMLLKKGVFPPKLLWDAFIINDIRLKQLLKAVMYLNGRLSAIENEMGVTAPDMDKVDSVRDALSKIVREGKAIAASSSSLSNIAAAEQQLIEEDQD
ncbi:hypothetical protein JST56_05655 [Candidatus Dependentiae bacterium]|nr:hypothetical protein [Candidatus Dependentiae bacterium]